VIINTITPLNQVDSLPPRQVGKLALDFSRLLKLKIKTCDGFVIPSETLKQIAHHNDLYHKIDLIEETADWENEHTSKAAFKKIRTLIANQKIPSDIAEVIVKKTEKLQDKSEFLQIQTTKNSLDNINGSANLLESILELWAQSYRKGEEVIQPILILTQNQPDASGVVKIDRLKKNIVQVKAALGVYDSKLGPTNKPDRFEINLSSETIVSRHLNPRKIVLKRVLDDLKITKAKDQNAAAITDSQALTLANYCQKFNRQTLGRRKLYFEIKNGRIFISKIFEPSQKTSQDSELILLGQSVTGGFIEGFVQVLKTPQEALGFMTGNILVKKSLDHLDQNLILKASAIIIEEKTLSPVLIDLINEHHVPCIVGASFATTKLYTNQKIVVDAGAGRLLKPILTAQPTVAPQTITKVFLSAGNPYKTEQYKDKEEGIFLKSDYAIAFIGVHPNHILRTQKQQFFDNLNHTIKTFLNKKPNNFFYRSCNLNSQELNSLSNSHSYEKLEQNPYLGTRGALKILEDETLFVAELKAVNDLANKEKRTVNFVLPWVRTATELAILFKKIDQTTPDHPYLKFWLQLNTPANVFNLSEFLHLPISGVTVQAKTIHDLAYGLDPDNPDLERYYTFDHQLIGSMLENIAQVIRQSKLYTGQIERTLPVVLKLNHYYSDLVTVATKLSLRAVVVKPSLFAIVKQQIVATQNQILK